MKEQLEKCRAWRYRPEEREHVNFYDLFFADDVTLAMAHTIREAWGESVNFKGTLAEKGLNTTQDKSANVLRPPGETVGGFYGRVPNGHRAAAMGSKRGGLPSCEMGASSSEGGEGNLTTIPFAQVSQLKILGVVLDQRFGFTAHSQHYLPGES